MAKTKPKRLEWGKLALIDRRHEIPEDRVIIDGTITLLITGEVFIRDRWFRGKRWFFLGPDAIDYAFPGGHAYRDYGSQRLVIRTSGPDRRTLVYEYCSPFLGVTNWYQLYCHLK